VKRGDIFYCEAGGEAAFVPYAPNPLRVSNSFSASELMALDYAVTQLLRGSFGAPPRKVLDGIQSLGRKSRVMIRKLEIAQGNVRD